jgi:hypothetical protein
MDKITTIKQSAESIFTGNIESAKNVINKEYPFKKLKPEGRSYTDKEKYEQFVRDGFIDRYTGEKLVNPGLLKALSYYMPDTFPYQSHWKMEECHSAYWELVPTIDHIVPIALGGEDKPSNYATTSMLHNSVKSNWTLEQLNWKLYPAGDINEYDGLTDLFVRLTENDLELFDDPYIKRWYKLSVGMK